MRGRCLCGERSNLGCWWLRCDPMEKLGLRRLTPFDGLYWRRLGTVVGVGSLWNALVLWLFELWDDPVIAVCVGTVGFVLAAYTMDEERRNSDAAEWPRKDTDRPLTAPSRSRR